MTYSGVGKMLLEAFASIHLCSLAKKSANVNVDRVNWTEVVACVSMCGLESFFEDVCDDMATDNFFGERYSPYSVFFIYVHTVPV